MHFNTSRSQSRITLPALSLSAVVAMSCLASKGQDVKFEELKKSIAIENGPVKAAPGVVSTYADALEKAMPAVVTVFSSKQVEVKTPEMFRDPMFRRFFEVPEGYQMPPHKEQGLGSGVIISKDGYILTNNHVVGEMDEIQVKFPGDNKEYKAKLIGADPKSDVAIIKIDAPNLKPIVIGDSSALRVGDVVLAVGSPFGLDQTVTQGIVSAMGRKNLNITDGGYENFIQTDAPINRGNSGGALIDAAGRLVGINTAIQSGVGGGSIGIGFAIPSGMALSIVERLLDGGGTVHRGFLGVFLKDVDSDMASALGLDGKSGVIIAEVGPESPAEKAGLKAGDLVVSANNKAATSMAELRLDVSNTKPGTKMVFEVIRRGKSEKVEVTLGDLQDSQIAQSGGEKRGEGRKNHKEEKGNEFIDGVRISDLDAKMREALGVEDGIEGVVVESVDTNSKAAEAGLQTGLLITQVDQQDVKSVAEVKKIREAFQGDVLLLQIYREGRHDILAIRIK